MGSFLRRATLRHHFSRSQPLSVGFFSPVLSSVGAGLGELNRIVTMWLDCAEDPARRRKEVFLKFNERDM
jgi:hypothetical protein